MKQHNFLVLQHIDCEHPGIFRHYFQQDNINWHPIELDQGETIPDLTDYDALWVMGGPMDVWQEDEYPWLVEEKRIIRHAVMDLKMPFLGFCLGHQLLAEALGGKVGPSQIPEIGIMQVHQTDAGQKSPFFKHLPQDIDCLQWHSAEVTEAPEGIEILAQTPACKIQAMSYQTHAFSMQYHVEVEDDTVRNWGDIPEYASALEKALGQDALPNFIDQAEAKMDIFKASSRQIYDNFMRAIETS